MISKRIELLREYMKKEKIDVYLIPTADFHQSEYVGEYFNTRYYMSGFSGSAGTLIVTQKEAGLWTDGRYFIQAEQELEGSGIDLYKMGVDHVVTPEEFIREKVPNDGTLGFDGRVVDAKFGLKLEENLKKKNAKIVQDKDLVDFIWEERPELSKEPIFLLETKYSGKSTKDKLAELRSEMESVSATTFILTSLDDIAWLFNIRGNDIPCNPVVLSFAIITKTDATLFIQSSVVSDAIKDAIIRDGVYIREYHEIYDAVRNLNSSETVLMDTTRVNYRIVSMLDKEIKVIDQINPTTLAKAKKNATEIENLRKSHIKDGVAVTKFMYWLKTNLGKIPMTEISASEYLEGLRKEQTGYIEPSFHTISAYGANAAMMHYSASETSNATLEPGAFLLVDSGGQYYEGTTDITRTFALGEVSEELKKHFTLVLKSNMNLANAKFLHGCTGMNLDILARVK